MSQVIVENDNLKDRRLKSADQEMRIDTEGQFDRWRRNDITGFDPIAAAAGLAVAPVVVFFWVFSKLTQLAILVSVAISQVIGKIVGKMKSP